MIKFGDARDEIAERARRAGMKVESIGLTAPRGPVLHIYFPNGAILYPIEVLLPRARILAKCGFEHWIVLGDYLAIYDKKRKLIEANIEHLEGDPQTEKSLIDLPGISWGSRRYPGLFDDSDCPTDFEEALAASASREGLVEGRPWSLPLRKADETSFVKFFDCPDGLLALDFPEPVDDRYWKIGVEINQDCQGHDEALKLLEQISSTLFFELDLRYDIRLGLVRRRLARPRVSSRVAIGSGYEMRKAPQMPRVRYRHDAVSLYLHGRSSTRLPLSQFLAYYQAIEYHFPMFVERDLFMRVRNKLRDPGFSPENNVHVEQLIRLMGKMRGGRYLDEWEQLAIVLSECVSEEDLIDFLKDDELRWKAIRSKGIIEGVHVIKENDQSFPLVRQMAQRIHQIRCRIVHAKEDGGPKAMSVLLPTSLEVRNLSHDIDIVRYLAQKVIIAGAES